MSLFQFQITIFLIVCASNKYILHDNTSFGLSLDESPLCSSDTTPFFAFLGRDGSIRSRIFSGLETVISQMDYVISWSKA